MLRLGGLKKQIKGRLKRFYFREWMYFLRVIPYNQFVLNARPANENIDKFPMGERIPKKIFQIFSSSKDLPDELKENINFLKNINPEYEYTLFNEEMVLDYISTNYPQLMDYYLRISPVYGSARADFFRYLLMYKEGGVYLDVKSSCRRPLRDLINEDDKYLLSTWDVGSWGKHLELKSKHGEYQIFFIISVPGHPFLKEVIESVVRNIDVYKESLHKSSQIGVLNLTGPIAYTIAIERIRKLWPHRIISSEEEGLVPSVFGLTSKRHTELYSNHYSREQSRIVLKR
ncbi:MAG: glycosyltransferase family 32 protein [Thiotrichales bacterium]